MIQSSTEQTEARCWATAIIFIVLLLGLAASHGCYQHEETVRSETRIRIEAEAEIRIKAIENGLVQKYEPGTSTPIWTKP